MGFTKAFICMDKVGILDTGGREREDNAKGCQDEYGLGAWGKGIKEGVNQIFKTSLM